MSTLEKRLATNDRVCGRLVYAPTAITERLPWDVQALKESDPSFPHTSTVNEFFTDQRFEAYRTLGRYAARSAIEAMNSPPDSINDRRAPLAWRFVDLFSRPRAAEGSN